MPQPYHHPPTPSGDNPRLIEALFRIESIGGDLTDIKQAIREMAVAVNKLAVVEERQVRDRSDLNRIFAVLETQDGRLKTIEVAQPTHKQTSDWINKGIWLLVGGALTAILSIVLVSPMGGRQTQNPIALSAPASVFTRPVKPDNQP